MFSGVEIGPKSQWKLGDFFPNLEKKNPYLKKKKDKYIYIYFKIGNFFQDHHTHTHTPHKLHDNPTTITSYFSFNLMAI